MGSPAGQVLIAVGEDAFVSWAWRTSSASASPSSVTYCAARWENTLHLPSTTGFTLVLVANLRGVARVPLGGRLADRYGRKPVLFTFAGITLLGVLLYFPLLNTRSWPLMLPDWTGSPWSIAGLLAAAYVLSLVLIACTPETKDVDVHGTTDPAHA